jgi:hypothetical protein
MFPVSLWICAGVLNGAGGLCDNWGLSSSYPVYASGLNVGSRLTADTWPVKQLQPTVVIDLLRLWHLLLHC